MKLIIKARKLHGRRKVHGMDVSVENAKGTTRRWYDEHGKETGSTYMHHDYGYIRGTLGTDGDHVDVYVGPHPESKRVFVVTQMKKPDFKQVDEQKVMLGFKGPKAAKRSYLRQYNDDRFFGSMKEMHIDDFKSHVFDKENHGEIIKAGPHKYISRKPDGKGGWIYIYPKEPVIGSGAYSTVSARDEHTVTKRTKSKTDLHAFLKMRADQAMHGDRRGVLRVSKVDLKKDKNGAYPIIVERARTETDWREGEHEALAAALEFAIGTKPITESYVRAIQARLPGHGDGDAARIASFAEDLRQGARAVVEDDHPDPKLDNIGLVKRDGRVMAVWLDYGSQDEVVKADPKPNHKYKSRKPDGKGGWIYEYDEPKETTGRTGSMRTRDEDVRAAVDKVFDVDDMREGKMEHCEVFKQFDDRQLKLLHPNGANLEEGDDFVVRFEPGKELGYANIHFMHPGRKRWEWATVYFRSQKPGESSGGRMYEVRNQAAAHIEVIVPDLLLASAVRRTARQILSHELTHAHDTITHTKESRRVQREVSQENEQHRNIATPEQYKAYRNLPAEVTASLHEFHRDLTDKKAIDDLRANAREAEDMSDEDWEQQIIPPLAWAKKHAPDLADAIDRKLYTPKNEKRVLRMLADTYQGILEGRVKPIRKAMWASNGFTRDEAEKLAKLIDLDFAKHRFTLADFTEGLNVELEHKDVTHGKAVMTAKIALAHLKERPDYYRRLRAVEDEVKKSKRFLSIGDIAALRKADGSKPPGAGWSSIPGGHKGGFRRRKGAEWEYWYPEHGGATHPQHHEAPSKPKVKQYTEADYESGNFVKDPLKWHRSNAPLDLHSKKPVKYAGRFGALYQIVKPDSDDNPGHAIAVNLADGTKMLMEHSRIQAVDFDPNRSYRRVESSGPTWTPEGGSKGGGFNAEGGGVSGERAPVFEGSRVSKEKSPGTWAIENGAYPMKSVLRVRREGDKIEREKATVIGVPDYGKQQLVTEYEGLIANTAKNAVNRFGLKSPEARQELHRAGIEGLLNAIDAYKAQEPFAALAAGYVRNYVHAAAARERIGGVRLDARFERNLGRFFTAQRRAQKEHGRDTVSAEEVAKHLDVRKKHFISKLPTDVGNQPVPMDDWRMVVKGTDSRDTRTRPGKVSIARAYQQFIEGEGGAETPEELAAFPALHVGFGLDPYEQIAVREAADNAAKKLASFEHTIADTAFRANMHDVIARKFGLTDDADEDTSISKLADEIPIYAKTKGGAEHRLSPRRARKVLPELITEAVRRLAAENTGHTRKLIEEAGAVLNPPAPPPSGPTFADRLKERAAAVSDSEVGDYREAERGRLERLRSASETRRAEAISEAGKHAHEQAARAALEARARVDRMSDDEVRMEIAKRQSPLSAEMRRLATATVEVAPQNPDEGYHYEHSRIRMTDPRSGTTRDVRVMGMVRNQLSKADEKGVTLHARDAFAFERYPQLMKLLHAPDTLGAAPTRSRRVLETLAGLG